MKGQVNYTIMAKKYKFIKYFTYEGKRYVVRADSEPELYMKIANKQRDLREGRVTVSGDMLVRDWIPRVLDTYKPNISDNYREQMELRIKKHITAHIGDLRLKSIKPLQCQEILNKQQGKSKSHIKKLHQELVFIFEKAKENHLILENPADHLIRPEGYQGKRRSITDIERKHLLAVCENNPVYNLFLLMLYAGCRPGEAAIVQGTDLIKKNGVYLLHIRGTKTENSDRYVPVVPELLPILIDLDPFQLASPNHAGRQHSESSYKRLVDHLRRDMNISMGCKTYRNKLVPPLPLTEDFVPYMLRHTFCTDLQKKGVDIRAAQKLMGHADIQTTANIYTHQDEDTLMQAAKQMGVAVGVAVECPDSSKNVLFEERKSCI